MLKPTFPGLIGRCSDPARPQATVHTVCPPNRNGSMQQGQAPPPGSGAATTRVLPLLTLGTRKFRWSNAPSGFEACEPFRSVRHGGQCLAMDARCYAESYAAAPNNGTVAEMGNQCLRVDRGGSWNYATWLLRSATRERNPPDYRDRVMGFAWQRRCRELRAYVPDFRSNERKANPFGVGIRQCRCDHLYCRAATRCQ